MNNEEQLLNDRQLRDEMSEKYEVLEKVKELLLIPKTDFANTKQVSDYYEVELDTVQKIIQRNDDELISDGILKLSGSETKEKLGVDTMSVQNFRGYFTINGVPFNNKSNTLFPRRAILRVGMLLRDSEVAKEVRTQLLNIEEKTSNETKTQDIEEEQKLMLSIGMAVASGNATAVAIASSNLVAFKNRHIEQLQTDNKALAGEILTWEDRSKLNAGMRKLAASSKIQVGIMWNELYKELLYKHHIDVKSRNGGKKPWIENIKENEWKLVMKTFSAMCDKYGFSSSEMINQYEIA